MYKLVLTAMLALVHDGDVTGLKNIVMNPSDAIYMNSVAEDLIVYKNIGGNVCGSI